MEAIYFGPGQSSKTQNFKGDGIAPQLMSFDIAALAAGVDLAGLVLAKVPTGYKMTVLQADVISQGSSVGIDATNTAVVVLKNGADAMVTKTYNDVTGFPEDAAIGNLGTIAKATLAAAGILSLYITNGATAATPKFKLQLLVSFDQA